MKIGDIMTTSVVSSQKDSDIGTAARAMLTGHFGTLPVLDAHGTLVGIITDRDIAMAAATRQRNASHISVHEAMSPKPHCCHVEDEVGAGLKVMEAARVRRLPVLGANGSLRGIVSIDDIVLHALDRPGGVSSTEFIATLRRICSQPEVEPDIRTPDTFVSG
jgi:CBS domain-containing protein